VFAPGDVAAENAFDDEVVGAAGDVDADAEVDLPLLGDVEVRGEEELLLLVVDGVGREDAAGGAVVLEARLDLPGEVVADFQVRGEDNAVANTGAVPGAVERGVEGDVIASDLLIDDGTDFPGEGIGRDARALIADFVGEGEADGPVPARRDADARADVVAYPVIAAAGVIAGEDLEAEFEPVVNALSDFDSFVLGVVGGKGAVVGVDGVGCGLEAVDGEVRVELDHGGPGLYGFGAVDLDFVVVLGAETSSSEQEQRHKNEDAIQPTHDAPSVLSKAI